MLYWMSGLTLKNRVQNEHIMDNLKISPIDDKFRETHLRWFGHIIRRLNTAQCIEVRGYGSKALGESDL